jgi:outer membrane PBP1 activator LpoA protein
MNGIMFADTPWVIDPQPWIEHLPGEFEKYWPEERRLARLHAMGYDAYNLIASLYSARGGNMAEIDGATGELYLDMNGRIHRRLAWAQFQRGEAVALPSPEETGGPIENISDDGAVVDPNAADEAPWNRRVEEL